MKFDYSLRKGVHLFSTILATTIIASILTAFNFYYTELDTTREILRANLGKQARLIAEIVKYDQSHPAAIASGKAQTTLSQIRTAVDPHIGVGRTSNFTLAKLENNHVAFLFGSAETMHEFDPTIHQNIPLGSENAIPMQLALSGRSGTMIIRGAEVASSLELDMDQAVPVALVVNELIMNAIKHMDPLVEVSQIIIDNQSEASTFILKVSNPGSLPEGFNFAAGTGLGTGLEIVKSMLPSEGVELSIIQESNFVIAELKLEPAILSVEKA